MGTNIEGLLPGRVDRGGINARLSRGRVQAAVYDRRATAAFRTGKVHVVDSSTNALRSTHSNNSPRDGSTQMTPRVDCVIVACLSRW